MAWPEGTDLIQKAPVLVAEFLVWWHQAGERHYGKGADRRFGPSRPLARRLLTGREHLVYHRDDGLRGFALTAVLLIGGWANARILMRGWPPDPGIGRKPPARGIRLRKEGR
jgi:hypothetical protein